jgi:hypothetical protein
MTVEHVRQGGEVLQETRDVLGSHNLLRNISEVAGVETFRTVSTSWLLMTKLDALIGNDLGGGELWDVLWNAFNGEFVSRRRFGVVQTPKVQSIGSYGALGSSIVILAT